MTIQLAFCSVDTLPSDLTEILNAFPLGEADAERLRSIQNDRSLRQSVAARIALLFLCPSGGTIVRGEHGKPRFAEDGLPHFSLSHSDTLAVAAISDEPFGIDLELDRPELNTDAIARRFFSDGDLADLHTHGDFFALWTKKGAISKCLGKPLTETLSKTVSLSTRTYRNGAFTLSLAAKREFSVESNTKLQEVSL